MRDEAKNQGVATGVGDVSSVVGDGNIVGSLVGLTTGIGLGDAAGVGVGVVFSCGVFSSSFALDSLVLPSELS